MSVGNAIATLDFHQKTGAVTLLAIASIIRLSVTWQGKKFRERIP
jgi:hypothetical protein